MASIVGTHHHLQMHHPHALSYYLVYYQKVSVMVPPFLLTFLKAFPLDLHFPCKKEKAPDVESHQNRDNLQKTVKHWFWRNYQFLKDAEPDRNQYLSFCSSKSLDPCVLISDSSEGSNSGVLIGNEGHMYITICYMFTAMG